MFLSCYTKYSYILSGVSKTLHRVNCPKLSDGYELNPCLQISWPGHQEVWVTFWEVWWKEYSLWSHGFKSLFSPLPAVWTWTSYLTSLSLIYFIGQTYVHQGFVVIINELILSVWHTAHMECMCPFLLPLVSNHVCASFTEDESFSFWVLRKSAQKLRKMSTIFCCMLSWTQQYILCIIFEISI